MQSTLLPNRAARTRRFGGLTLLVALWVGLLQTGMPLAHGLAHLFTHRAHAHAAQPHSQPELQSTPGNEQACPLCASDEIPALPGPAPTITALRGSALVVAVPAARTHSRAPLDVFCRPPPVV